MPRKSGSEIVYPRTLKSGVVYYGKVRLSRGEWKAFNTQKTDPKKAREVVRLVQMEIDSGRNPFGESVSHAKTVASLVNDYLEAHRGAWASSTLKMKVDSLNRLIALIGNEPPDAIASAINSFRSKLAHLSPHSQNIHIRNLRTFCFWIAAQDRKFEPPVIKTVKAPLEKEVDNLSDSEIRAILTECENLCINGVAIRSYIEFLILTGMRRGEALSCCWEWFRYSEQDDALPYKAWKAASKGLRPQLIRIPASVSKTDERRFVPVTDRVWELIRESNPTGEGLVFPRLTIKVTKLFKTAVKQAGIARPLKLHNCRDTFIIRAIRAGVDLSLVARISGHDVQTLMRHYASFSEEAYREAGKMLNFGTFLVQDASRLEKQ